MTYGPKEDVTTAASWWTFGPSGSMKAVSHHQIGAGLKVSEKAAEIAQIVAVVGIPHDDVTSARRGDARREGGTVTAQVGVNDACAAGRGDRLRSVGAAIVGHQHLAAQLGFRQKRRCLADADSNSFGFIQARNKDGQNAGVRAECAETSAEGAAFEGVRATNVTTPDVV